jgi:hypothetical protein
LIASSNFRIDPICFSPYLYRARNLIERFFNKIKQYRRVATRYDKLAANYLAFVKLASIRIWLRANESTIRHRLLTSTRRAIWGRDLSWSPTPGVMGPCVRQGRLAESSCGDSAASARGAIHHMQ